MTPKQLVLKTADYIEANPGLFNFHQTHVPKCNSPGCVIGLAAMIATGYTDRPVSAVCNELFNMDSGEFYKALGKHNGHNWAFSSNNTVINLRLLAEDTDDKPEELEPALVKFMSTLEGEKNVTAMLTS